LRQFLTQHPPVDIMTSPRTAHCSCGQLSATVSAEPLRISVCHCLNCQRRSGSAFAAQARFPAGAVVLAGTSTAFVRTGDEGGRCTFHFCPRCGDTVYYVGPGGDDQIAIPIGAFADPHFPAPTVSVYEGRRHAWVGLPADIVRWD
jgi:hypothetical protein